MKTKNDISFLKRDIQGLLGIVIAITPDNEEEKIKSLIDYLGCLAINLGEGKYNK